MGAREIVEAGFREQESRDYAATYLSELLTTWRDAEKSMARAALLMFVFGLAAELVTRGEATEVTLGFVKLADLTLFSQALPVAVAYLYSSIGNLAAEASMMETAFREAVRANWPSLWRSNLERCLYPSGSIFLSGDKLIYTYRSESSVRRLISGSATIRALAVVVVPIGFLLYMSVRLFERYGVDALTIASAALSGLLVIAGLIGFLGAGTALRDDAAMIPGPPDAPPPDINR